MLDEKIAITESDPKAPVSEAYRVLRTNVQFSGIDKKLKTIVVTSSEPMEGKTTTVVNLAISFAQMGSKVLLIDADFRKPKIHKVFFISNGEGLTNFLAAHDDYNKYIRQSSVQNLSILPSGTIPPNPSELLNSTSMKQFIETVQQEYDLILLDSPPVGSVTDACIISAYVDGTIIVVNSGKVTIQSLKRAVELLNKVNANIIGVVLNNVDRKSSGDYNYYQYYYSEDGENRKKHRKRKLKKTEPQQI